MTSTLYSTSSAPLLVMVNSCGRIKRVSTSFGPIQPMFLVGGRVPPKTPINSSDVTAMSSLVVVGVGTRRSLK
jgi:hypothetical protein